MKPAIAFTNVSKRYNLSKQKGRSVQELFTQRFRKSKAEENVLWVLKDINFSIQPGESVAFIGPNGAGKSTILKLISSIVMPTAGRIEINGRVSSLLELGAGFHPDLTGRENIYLNGSIIGLSRKEIDRKYDMIVDFAEMADYIDLPVKHYSSGMYLRLAFAVASHVEPDILLIDEVIAVGDHLFQQRCFKRLAQLKRAGVTLVLISHSMELVRHYCQRGLWLEQGHIQAAGEIERVAETYLAAQYESQTRRHAGLPERVLAESLPDTTALGQTINRWGSGQVEIIDVELLGQTGQPQTSFRVGEALTIRAHYQASTMVKDPVFGIAIYRADDLHINGPNTRQASYHFDIREGRGYVDYTVEALNLLPAVYDVSVAVYDSQIIQAYDHHHRLHHFQVLSGSVKETTGSVYLPARWSHHPGDLFTEGEQAANTHP